MKTSLGDNEIEERSFCRAGEAETATNIHLLTLHSYILNLFGVLRANYISVKTLQSGIIFIVLILCLRLISLNILLAKWSIV